MGAKDGPEEAAEFAGNSNQSFVAVKPAGGEFHESGMKTILRFPGDG